MKYFLPLVALALFATTGCHSQKPTTSASALDLTAPSPAYTATPTAYTPAPAQPMAAQPIMADPSVSATPAMNASLTTGNTYTVQKGDTLWKIAATHYGDGKKWQLIANANPGLTPSKLRVGQTITLP
jgi:5'-nucleotidase